MTNKIYPGDIISHNEMCMVEKVSLQRGMNFRIKGGHSVFLMSVRPGAPYNDRVEEKGSILIYEGHDAQKGWVKYPKQADQPMYSPKGSLTQNGKFFDVAINFKDEHHLPELIRVYEKIKDGIWSYNGVFELIDAWLEESEGRQVFKFKLRITDNDLGYEQNSSNSSSHEIEHNRMIPTSVKLEVWKRDQGKCRQCGSTINLHFDHILPFSKGGTSLNAENIQLLCAKHNLHKHDKIV